MDEKPYLYIPDEDAAYVTGLLRSSGVGAPIVVINPGAKSHLKRWTAAGFAEVLDDVLSRRLRPTALQRLGGTIDGRPLPVPTLNELLISHKSPASTSRYRVERPGRGEDHKSSGV